MNKIRLEGENDIMMLLDLATDAGSIMLLNGAEVYRVEDTTERIVKSVDGVTNVDVFATYSGLISSIKVEGKTYTSVRRIKSRVNNFNKVDKVNTFSRNFVVGAYDLKEARNQLDQINNSFFIPMGQSIIGTAFGSAAFTALLNKNIVEIIVSFFVALFSVILTEITSRRKMGYFLNNFFSGIFVSIITILFKIILPQISMDAVIIGSMMSFVPGSSLTNSVRDLLNGDIISGSAGAITAILIGLGLALGVSMPIMFFNRVLR